MRGTARLLAMLLMAMALGATHRPPPAAAADKALLKLRVQAVNLSGFGPASAGLLDITVERWSTDEERDRLRATLEQKGPDALMAVLMKLKPRAGYIRNPASSSVAWSIRFARVQALPDGGRQITLATDRPLSFWEVMNRPRSIDYGFTLAEIRLDRHGKGEGKLVPAAKVTWNKHKQALEIENYGLEPVRLTQVTVDGGG